MSILRCSFDVRPRAPVEWGRSEYFNRSEERAFVWLVVRCFESEFAKHCK